MTLNGLMSLILHYFAKFGSFWGKNSLVVLDTWPWRLGSSRAPHEVLALALDDKVLALALALREGS